MSYISACNKQGDVIVWERTDKGRAAKHYPAPYYFYIKDENGNYTSIFGDKLSRIDFNSASDFYNTKREYESESGHREMFESDIAPELKVISQHYYEAPTPKLHITFHDIEVDYDVKIGFSSVENPYAPISSIALYHQWTNEYIVFVVPPNKEWYDKGSTSLDPEIQKMATVIFCKDEEELLINYIAEIEDSDLLCGWNSEFYDMPYIGKRIELIPKLGKTFFKKLSFRGGDEPKYKLVDKFGIKHTTLELSGRINADYLALFIKYEETGRRSYKLEAIADEELPDLPKLKYKGTLHALYRNDFNFFVRYNIRDVEILVGFEKKLGYVSLANEIYHLSGALFKHVTGTIKLSDLTIINYCHHVLNLIVPNGPQRDESEPNSEIEGALVIDPKIGEHEWVGAIDVKSLYPNSIRAINISPEMICGQFLNNEEAALAIAKRETIPLKFMHENGRIEEISACDWRDVLKKRKWAVSGYGTVFSQEKEGIVPAVIRTWYATRKKYQKIKTEALRNKDKDKTDYYNRLQYVYKIRLNSLYGAITNPYFRFFDLRMGESTTATGRAILRHQCAKVNEVLTGIYDTNGEAVIYGDTDSTYFLTWGKNKDEAVKIADSVAELVNKSYTPFVIDTFLCNPGFDEFIETSREILSDKGIFVDKKRYILHMVDEEGKAVDKMKVKGLDTKKTTLPKEIADKLNSFIERYLKGEKWDVISKDIVDFKEELQHSNNVLRIGLPKGIKGIEDYTHQYITYGDKVKLPGHVAAAIHYNQCLEKYGDKENVKITTGMKIKVYYLNQKYGKFKSIALPTDIDEVPTWFSDNFTVDVEAHIERLVDNPLQNILGAIKKEVPSKQSLFVDSLWDF